MPERLYVYGCSERPAHRGHSFLRTCWHLSLCCCCEELLRELKHFVAGGFTLLGWLVHTHADKPRCHSICLGTVIKVSHVATSVADLLTLVFFRFGAHSIQPKSRSSEVYPSYHSIITASLPPTTTGHRGSCYSKVGPKGGTVTFVSPA